MHRKQCNARKVQKARHKPLGAGRQVERNNHQPNKSNCQRQGKHPQWNSREIPSAQQKDTKSKRGSGHGGPDRNCPTTQPHPGKSTETHPRETGPGLQGGTHNRQGRPGSRRQWDANGMMDQTQEACKQESRDQDTPGPRDTEPADKQGRPRGKLKTPTGT